MRRVASRAGARLFVVTTLTAAVALSASACGGDDPPDDAPAATSTTVARQEWSRQLDDACDQLNRDYEQLEQADPDTRAEAVRYASQIEEFSNELVELLDEAGVPAEDRSDADQLAELADQLAVAAGDLVDAAQDGDADAVAEATERLEAVGERINPVADALDAPACGGF